MLFGVKAVGSSSRNAGELLSCTVLLISCMNPIKVTSAMQLKKIEFIQVAEMTAPISVEFTDL